jgi:hypothetical protein
MHGNAIALDAVLAELEHDPVDEIVCLGDVAQGGAQPAEVVDRLQELGCPCVFGNSDEFLLTLDAEASVEDLADYAVVSGSPLRVEFRRVPFDAREVVRAIRGSGMPDAERSALEWLTE